MAVACTGATRRWARRWPFELRELIEGGGDEVFAEGRQHGRAKGSGVAVSETIYSVWTVRAGKAVRQRMFRDRTEALEAAGLRE